MERVVDAFDFFGLEPEDDDDELDEESIADITAYLLGESLQ